MSCTKHSVNGVEIMINESADIGCLCTFPGNDEIDGEIGPWRLRILAYYGVAVALTRNMKSGEVFYVPDDIPHWIRKEIDTNIPDSPAPGGTCEHCKEEVR